MRSSPGDASKRARQLGELLQESVQIAIATGPKGLVRGLQAADAVLGLLGEYLQRGMTDAPEVVLRK
jgi:hypothetical protein